MAEETVVNRAGPRRDRPQVRKRNRTAKLTEAKRAGFLLALGETCNVTASAQAVGLTPTTMHKLRHRDPVFRQQWSAALAEGYAKLELTLLERAINGTEKETRGEDGGLTTKREFSERLALDLLRQHRQTVAAERARAAADAVAGEAPAEDAMGELIARINEMSERLADDPA